MAPVAIIPDISDDVRHLPLKGTPLSESNILLREALVVAEDFETPFTIGHLARNIRVVEELPRDLGNADGLFLLNLSVEDALGLSQDWISRGNSNVHYWVTYEKWTALKELANFQAELGIANVDYDEDWIKLIISSSSAEHVDVPSFIVGLSALRHSLALTPPPSPTSQLTEPSFKSLLIKQLIPIMKPLKRFIPHKIVIYMYKILEKLR